MTKLLKYVGPAIHHLGPTIILAVIALFGFSILSARLESQQKKLYVARYVANGCRLCYIVCMNIGIIDCDKTKFPNLALMKISAYHKKNGDSVEFVKPQRYDIVYSSKVFTYKKYERELYTTSKEIRGGTGFDFKAKLKDEIEHIMPDYSLYGVSKAYGFLTRGCPNKCGWCIVPKKEGGIIANADITEFWNGQKEAILLDNNVLAHNHGICQIEKIAKLGIKIDFNQGLDARIISSDNNIAKLLSSVKWIRYIRLACDTKKQIPIIMKAAKNLNKYGVKNYRIFVYILVKDIDDALERVDFVHSLGCRPFAQPYIDFSGKNNVKKEQKHFARWANRPWILNKTRWEDYKYVANGC